MDDILVFAMKVDTRAEALAEAERLEAECIATLPVCEQDSSLLASDPACVPCAHDSNVLAGTQACDDLLPCAIEGLDHVLASSDACREDVIDVDVTIVNECGAARVATWTNNSNVPVTVTFKIDGVQVLRQTLAEGGVATVDFTDKVVEDGTHQAWYEFRYDYTSGPFAGLNFGEEVSWTLGNTDCEPPACDLDPSISSEDPACTPCGFDNTIIASDSECYDKTPCAYDENILATDEACEEPAIHNPDVEVGLNPCTAPLQVIQFGNAGTVDPMTVEVTVNGIVQELPQLVDMPANSMQEINLTEFFVEDEALEISYKIFFNGELHSEETVLDIVLDCEPPVIAAWTLNTSIVCGGSDSFYVSNGGVNSVLTLDLSVDGEIQRIVLQPGEDFTFDLSPYLVEDVAPTASLAYMIQAQTDANSEGITMTQWTMIDLGTARDCLPVVPEGDETGVEIQRVMPCGAEGGTVALVNNSDEFTAVITDVTDGIVTIQIDDVDDLDLDGTTFDFFTLVYSGGDCEETIEEEITVEVEDNDEPCVHNEGIASTDADCQPACDVEGLEDLFLADEDCVETIQETDEMCEVKGKEDLTADDPDCEELAITGGQHTNMAKYAGLMVALGAVLMLLARKRKDGEILLWAHSEIKYVA